MKKPQTLMIEGAAGLIETLYLPAVTNSIGIAVLNHPHPLQGGTNTNKVVQIAAKALTELGFDCYLANSRGIGKSEGQHDYGIGETDDCIAIIDYAHQQNPNADKFILGGFSFGGYIAVNASQQRAPDCLILIGPALGLYDHKESLTTPAKQTIIIHGEKDEVVPIENVYHWSAPQNLPVIVIPESSHYFHGKLIQLKNILVTFTPSLL